METETQLTSVEWLEEQWLKLDLEFTGLIDTKEYDKRRNFIIEQAKAMEKEQIKNSYHSGAIDGFNFKTTSISPNPEQYYNEIFKSE